jgi:AcrR family transcriptional regulator
MPPSDSAQAAPPQAAPPRARDSAVTRRALLEAARELFATEGYAGTTVRAVAERAGVNQALLFRHFGRKEALFVEALAGQALDLLHSGPPEQLLERTLASMLSEDTRGAGLFFAAVRSAGSADAAEAVRAQLGDGYRRVFATQSAAADPEDAALRADLLLAWLLGIGLLRTVLRTEPMAGAEPTAVTAHVVRAARALLRA